MLGQKKAYESLPEVICFPEPFRVASLETGTPLTNVDGKYLPAWTSQGASVKRLLQNLRENPVLQPEGQHKGKGKKKYDIPQYKIRQREE